MSILTSLGGCLHKSLKVFLTPRHVRSEAKLIAFPSLMVDLSTSEHKTTTKVYNHLAGHSINVFVEFGQNSTIKPFCLSDIESKVAWVNTT